MPAAISKHNNQRCREPIAAASQTGDRKHACMFRKTVAIGETTFSLGTLAEPDDRSDEVPALHDNRDTLRLDDCPIF